jgi:hypothetical protein
MFSQFKQLPLGVRVVLCGLSGTSLLGLVAMIDPSVVWILALGLALVALSLALYGKIKKWRDKRRAAALGAQLAQNSSSAPQGVSDPARRAKLDDLRQSFQKGVDKFRTAGKDIYSLPWYMVVGEPGSGKTEAIRHCNVGFPPGLQDEMQGAGGTINMHWWFTNQAVILDTAGKLLFQEAPPGTTTEWNEFLSLLKKNRTNCPINGLLLIIPSDSLIKDSGDEIARKAGKIAQQLDRIQRTLDVRFPVFVLVTKCDLVNGFREFFAGLKDPQLQHQMMGWSNPDPLDTAFRPDLVDQHLDQVCQRVRRRRLGLLKDPVADTPSGRRTDEVDALYALPQSLGALAPRLRRYLEMIFVAGEWSAKPLFLRGIYFTSALTEGKALDLEIAEAMGVAPDALPDGKLWERERSFFLRDLFLQKIFKERGLVTRASNTAQLMRRRQLLIFGTGSIALAALLAFSFWGARSVNRSVGGEKSFWTAAAAGWQDGNVWNPIVTPEFRGSTKFVYNGNNVIKVGDKPMSLVEFHARLHDLVSHDIPVPIVFKPLDRLVTRANSSRRRAQRIVFEDSVVLPLIQSARARLEGGKDPWNDTLTADLALLIQLEGMIHERGLLAPKVEFAADEFFNPLLGPWVDGGKVPDDLLSVFDWTYYKDGDGKGNWPTQAFSAGENFRENRPIAIGWENFQEATRAGFKTQQKGLDVLKQARTAAGNFRQAEQDFWFYAGSRSEVPSWRDEVGRRYAALDVQRTALDDVQKQAAASGLFPKGTFTLAGAYDALVSATRAQSEAGLKAFRAVIQKFVPTALQQTPPPPPPTKVAGITIPSASSAPAALSIFSSDFVLIQEVSSRVDRMDQEMQAQTQSAFSESDKSELPNLDKRYFGLIDNQPAYLLRAHVYRDAVDLFTVPAGTEKTLVGNLGKAITAVAGDAGAISLRVDKYEGELRNEFQYATRNLLIAAQQIRVNGLFALHEDTVGAYLRTNVGFPLVWDGGSRVMTSASIKEADTFLKESRTDLQISQVPDAARASFDLTTKRVIALSGIDDALVTPEGDPVTVSLLLVGFNDQRKGVVDRGLTQQFAASFAGNLWRSMRMGGRAFRTQVGSDTEIYKAQVSDTFPALELFLAPDVKAQPDSRYNFEPNWSALRLLRSDSIRRPGGKDWEAVLRMKDDTGTDQFLLVVCQFPKALPEVADWPTLSSLSLK